MTGRRREIADSWRLLFTHGERSPAKRKLLSPAGQCSLVDCRHQKHVIIPYVFPRIPPWNPHLRACSPTHMVSSFRFAGRKVWSPIFAAEFPLQNPADWRGCNASSEETTLKFLQRRPSRPAENYTSPSQSQRNWYLFTEVDYNKDSYIFSILLSLLCPASPPSSAVAPPA